MNRRIEQLFWNQKLRDRAKIFLLVFWLALIFFLSSLPGGGTIADLLTGVARKTAHFGEFAILMFLMFKALRLYLHESFYRALWTAIAFSSLYAASDEFHQLFVHGRFGTLRDVVIDLSGILIMSCLIYLEHEHQQQFSHKRHLVKM